MNLNRPWEGEAGRVWRRPGDLSFASGVGEYLPTIVEIFRSAQYRKAVERAGLKRDFLQEHEDKRDSDQLTGLIDADARLEPEEKQRLLQSIPANKGGLRVGTKEQRERLQKFYDDLVASKAETAKSEKAKADVGARVRAEFEAQKRRIPKGAEELRAMYAEIGEPTEADVAALRDDLKLWHERDKSAGNVSEAERKRQVRRQLVELGNDDPTLNRGFEVARESDPELYREAVSLGIKPEKAAARADRATKSEPARELLNKAYADYKARRKDSDELAVVGRLIGVDVQDAGSLSFREFLQ